MPRHVHGPFLSTLMLSLAVLAAAGCSATDAPTASANSAVLAFAGAGSVHLTAYSDNDGPTQTVIVTGVIGDFGQAVSTHPDGTLDPDHSSQLSMHLSHGSFRLDIAQLGKAFVSAMAHQFPTSAATCSGEVAVTHTVPVVPGSGAGTCWSIAGSFTLTLTLDEGGQDSIRQAL